MFAKIKSMSKLVDLGLNVHRYFIPNTYAEYLSYLKLLGFCTIRTDHAFQKTDLPFYVVNLAECTSDYIDKIWEVAQRDNYKLIMSDGVKYDAVQNYNLVVKFERNGDFMFEASELKIPLRHMYRYPMLSCYGNVSTEISEWDIIINKYGIDKRSLKRDLELLYTYGLHDKWLEVTKYPQCVGIKQEHIVFWQII